MASATADTTANTAAWMPSEDVKLSLIHIYFTVTCSAPGGAGIRTVYNPVPLYMGDRLREMPVDTAVAAFTTETPQRTAQILAELFAAQPFDSEFTRGLYYTNN